MNGLGVDLSVCLPGLVFEGSSAGESEGLIEPRVMWVGGRSRHKRNK